MEAILGTLVIGLIVGVIAKLLMPGRDPGGCLITILLGIAGAFVAGVSWPRHWLVRTRATRRLHRLGHWRDVSSARVSTHQGTPIIAD